MRMRLKCPKRMQAGVVATLAAVLFLGTARAGDPIQFSGDKAKPAAANNRPVDADLFKSWNKAGTPAASSINTLTPFITPGRTTMDPKDEKRLRNARDEKRNWMLLEPGELDKEDAEEEKYGKAFSRDKGDQDAGNYLFRGLGEAKSDRGRPQRPATDADNETKKGNRSSLKILGTREGEQGAHTASELNLKGLIDTSQGNPANGNKNEATLFQFFKENALPPPNRDEQARRENFRDFINEPQSPKAAGGAGLGDPINFRTDLTQERMNPVPPPRVFELPAPAKVPDAFSAKPPAMGGLNPARPLGFLEPMAAG